MLKIPYAVREFDAIITENYVYMDRTHHIQFMENWGRELLFMRPRRFGKSLWLSTLMHYYDVNKADSFEQLFGHLAIGQNPTSRHNSYLVMRWDFSRVASRGSIEQIEESLNDHINTRAETFQQEYSKYLRFPININPKNALSTFDLLVNATRLSGYKLYLFIDEYDNFANEVMMGSKGRDPKRYIDLVKGEGMFKTFFKNLKSAGSGDGLDRIFMTGVSPIVLNDVTSGANVFKNVSWRPELNELCGFTAAEVQTLAHDIVESCQLPPSEEDIMLQQLHNNYNGSLFVEDYRKYTAENPPTKVYNPTLVFYFLEEFQAECDYPKNLIDENLVPDDNKLTYISEYNHGRKLLEDALEGNVPISVQTLRKKFGIQELLNPNLQRDRLAVLLCYLGALTSVGETPDGQVILEIPNLVMRRLYGERVLQQLVQEDDDKITAGREATTQLLVHGDIQPLAAFVQAHLLSIYDNRDAKDFNELTLKTLFITLLYQSQMYLIDSEPEIERRYGDLIMMARPGMRQRGLCDILIEFKHLSLSKVTEKHEGKPRRLDGQAVSSRSHSDLVALENVKQVFDKAKGQLQSYRQKLNKKYQDDLDLHTYVVVSLGFDRILWEEVD